MRDGDGRAAGRGGGDGGGRGGSGSFSLVSNDQESKHWALRQKKKKKGLLGTGKLGGQDFYI